MIKKAETSKKNQFTDAIYHYETIISKKISKNYIINKSFVREVKIFYLGKKDILQHFYIACHKFKFSNEENSDVIFLKKLSYLWDEIEVLVNEENTIVKILNLTNLQLRWATIRNTLSLDHKGYAVENYFQTINVLLEKEEKVVAFLNSYKMFGMFFNGYNAQLSLPKSQKTVLQDETAVLEKISVSNEDTKTEVKISSKADDTSEEITRNGVFYYENNFLTEGYMVIKDGDKQIKHSLLWVG